MREIKVSSLQDTANLGEKLGKLLESGSLVTFFIFNIFVNGVYRA